MRFGCGSLDFGLKCWLMGFRILHDPVPVIGHCFRTSFDYPVPIEELVANQLRMAGNCLRTGCGRNGSIVAGSAIWAHCRSIEGCLGADLGSLSIA